MLGLFFKINYSLKYQLLGFRTRGTLLLVKEFLEKFSKKKRKSEWDRFIDRGSVGSILEMLRSNRNSVKQMFESRSTDPSPAIGLFAQGIVEIKHSLWPDSLNIYATPPLSLSLSLSPLRQKRYSLEAREREGRRIKTFKGPRRVS